MGCGRGAVGCTFNYAKRNRGTLPNFRFSYCCATGCIGSNNDIGLMTRWVPGRRGGVAPTSGGFCGDGSLRGLWVCAWILVIFGVICRVHFKRGSFLGVWWAVGAFRAGSLCCAVAACSSVVWQCGAVCCGALRMAAVRCVWVRWLCFALQHAAARGSVALLHYLFFLHSSWNHSSPPPARTQQQYSSQSRSL